MVRMDQEEEVQVVILESRIEFQHLSLWMEVSMGSLLQQYHTMAIQTQPTKNNVVEYVESAPRSEDAMQLLELFTEILKVKPVLWSNNTVGYGQYHYKYASGQEGDWMITGFSQRKANLTIYIMLGFDKYGDLLDKLGKFTTSKSCLYVTKLANIDLNVLKELISRSVTDMRKNYLDSRL